MKIFENRRLKGAVSIFLIIIILPTMFFSAVLIDGSRMASARAMTQEAADLAAISALAAYDQNLKDQFGLFAAEDSTKLEAIYKESLNATLLAYGMSGDAQYSERLWDIMKTTLTGEKSYMGASFLNLYDFSVDRCDVTPMFCLAEQNVLENQMVEYAKFRGLYVMADRMDLFSSLGNINQQAEQNQVTSEVMESKMVADESNSKADEAMVTLRKKITDLNAAIVDVKQARKDYLASLRAEMKQIRYENIDSGKQLTSAESKNADSYERNREKLKKTSSTACQQAGDVIKQAIIAQKEVEDAIGRLETFHSQNQSRASDNETVGDLLQDATDNIATYKKEYLPEIQKLLDDAILNEMDQDTNIESALNEVMVEIHKAITRYCDVISELREEQNNSGDESEQEEITEYFYYYLDHSGSTEDVEMAIAGGTSYKFYQPAVNKLLSYFIDASWDPEQVNPSKKYQNTTNNIISENFAKENSGVKENPDTKLEGESPRGNVDDTIYKTRPSIQKEIEAESGKKNNTFYYNKENDLKASKNILEQGKRSMILDVGEVARDDILCLSYMFGTFKTRLTGVNKFSSEGMSESDKNSFYMPQWRYAHPEGELDMRFSPKKDRKTVLRSEIEYLIYGNRTDEANEAAVYATIFAERLANNLIVMYADRDGINLYCHAAAGTSSLMTAGFVPEPVFFWIFLTAWATAETIIEMDYLISGGYRIPLLKTTKNILLKSSPGAKGDGLLVHYGEDGFFVCYEDYLLILLLLKGREKRIMRSADLIEMNMKKNGSSNFTMGNACTYLQADTKLSIRYLFGSVTPFGTSYEDSGYTGRMRFNNTIYMGY